MSESKISKVGEIKIKAGEFVGDDGKTRNRYISVGALFATPHFSRMAIKFYPTIQSEEKWASVFFDEGKAPNFAENSPEMRENLENQKSPAQKYQDRIKQIMNENSGNPASDIAPINADDIPF